MLKYVNGAKRNDTAQDGTIYRVTVEVNVTEYTVQVFRPRHMPDIGFIELVEQKLAEVIIHDSIRSNLRELIERKAE